MFKNATIYKITQDFQPAQEDHDNLLTNAFAHCGPTQITSSGWIPPRGEEHGELMEIVGGHCLMKLLTETRRVPAEAIQRHVDAAAANIEKTTGRKPGKKERRELKEEALLELLPRAFPTLTATLVWLDPKAQMLVIDTASPTRADLVATHLVGTLTGLVLAPVQTQVSPSAAMAEWLCDMEAPPYFSVDRECELESADESQSKVKYVRHQLDITEVTDHISGGKVPKALAMTWNNKVSFLLTDSMHLKRLEFLDVVFEGGKEEKADAFDANVALLTGELSLLIPDIVTALGGTPPPQDNQ